jgi:hypothetical protein
LHAVVYCFVNTLAYSRINRRANNSLAASLD